jgi:hypothetical protein
VPIKLPEEYTEDLSGTTVYAFQGGRNMSIIGSDYFDLGTLTENDWLVDFPDGHVLVVNYAELHKRFTRTRTGCWFSMDHARSFAMEMQYFIDHPEEWDADTALSSEEVAEVKAFIRSAKQYLAERDESL